MSCDSQEQINLKIQLFSIHCDRMSSFWILLQLMSMTNVVVTTGASRHTELQSNRRHQQPTPSFLQAGCFPVAQPTMLRCLIQVNSNKQLSA